MYYSTAKEMEKLDELAVAHGLDIAQMMELAGWHMLTVFDELSIREDKKITVVAGKGNKGGDGLSAARHLQNHGYTVSVVLASRELKSDPQHHLKLLEKMQTPVIAYDKDKSHSEQLIAEADVVIDALLGYHLEGSPRGVFADLISRINTSNALIIAYDMPSGVDATSGECFAPCIRADATLTLAMPKKVFQTESGHRNSGKVFLGDIGIPELLYNQLAKGSAPDFGNKGVIQIV
jgi:NAD(P)H-hydrate epimerase